jgi:phosphomannomutase
MTEIMQPIKFGTDGWRALMATDFTFQNVERLTQAFADYMTSRSAGKKPRVVIGYDFRENSDKFAETVARILIANGFEIVLSDQPIPTPAVSSEVIRGQYDAGVVLTASHNPGGYNGFKIKNRQGSSAELEITGGVEKLLDQNPVRKDTRADLNAVRKNILSGYFKHLKSYLNIKAFQNKKFRILIDSMHGVGANHIAEILKNTPIEVTTIRSERDIHFGGTAPEPIPKNFKQASELMKSGDFDACFVTDGDADRVGAIRPGGDFVSPGKLLSLIMMHMVEDLGKKGDVVTTVSNTAFIYKTARALGLKIHETPVGFKYVVDIMGKHNVLIAGEESGGIAFQGYMPERDGLLSSLLMIQMMEMRGQDFETILKKAEAKYGVFLYAREDSHYPEKFKKSLMRHLAEMEPKEIAGVPVAKKMTLDGVKFIFKNDAWLLFRMSGTEPLLRIYAESDTPGQAETLVAWGKELAFSRTQ